MKSAVNTKLPVILFEQLSYLIRHYAEHTGVHPQDCGECSRFKQVEKALLSPFESKVYRTRRSVIITKRKHARQPN